MACSQLSAKSLTLVASAAFLWGASSDTASAQSRLFSCPHARIIELTVKGPDTLSADRDDRKPLTLKRDPANRLRFVGGKFAVTLTPDQGALTLDAPDWGATKCLFGSQDVKPFIPQRIGPRRRHAIWSAAGVEGGRPLRWHISRLRCTVEGLFIVQPSAIIQSALNGASLEPR